MQSKVLHQNRHDQQTCTEIAQHGNVIAQEFAEHRSTRSENMAPIQRKGYADCDEMCDRHQNKIIHVPA